jgi:para-nitrobenzyl esterase
MLTLPRRLAALLSAAALAAASAPALAQTAPTVDAPSGVVQGAAEGALVVFKGIPYAQPPVGELRWRAPQPLPRWAGTRTATQFGASCLQPSGPSVSVYADDVHPFSEDCLTLNIWAPKDARGAPVLFWIHGGALLTGSSREAIYDGSKLAAKGIVVVSINYRLGILGYLAHPELSAESPLKVSGNYGLLDQIQALRWVKTNISTFGGDPADVTIAGQSAGALSVMYLMVSPPARGLFSKAIAESAYMVSTPELRRRPFGDTPAEAMGQMVMSALQAPNIAAMRAIDAREITADAARVGFPPSGTVDGVVLPKQLVEVFDRGEQAPVPLLAGFNSGEIRSLMVLAPKAPAGGAPAYEQTIRDRYGDLADAFLRLYPSADLHESIIATTRDALYGWTAERLVRKQSAIGQPAFLYLFDHPIPSADAAGLHGFHAAELPYVFGTLDRTPAHWPKAPDTPAEATLSEAMVSYWSSFVKTGQPGAAGEPAWPVFGANGAYLLFGETPKVSDHLMPGMYALQEEVVCRRRAAGGIPWTWNVGLASPKLPPKTERCP